MRSHSAGFKILLFFFIPISHVIMKTVTYYLVEWHASKTNLSHLTASIGWKNCFIHAVVIPAIGK